MVQSILIGLLAVLGLCDYLTGTSMIQRPIVLGTLAGVVFGDPVQGVIIGSSIELVFMGVMYIGGAAPVNALSGGLITTAIALKTGMSVEAAIAIAMPIGAVLTYLDNLYYFIIQLLIPSLDKSCAEGETKGVGRFHWTAFAIWAALYFACGFLVIQFGADYVGNFFDALPPQLVNGLGAATSLLPALGFALLINTIWNKKVAAFFFIGFALVAYLGMGTVGVSVIAICIGVLFFTLDPKGLPSLSIADAEEGKRKLTKQDLTKIFFRGLTMEASYSMERAQGTGYLYAILPGLKKQYGDDKEGLADAMTRGSQFVCTTPQCSPILMGMTLALEEQFSNDKENMDPNTINAVKSAFMGPLAGVGDSFFWGIWRTVTSGIACSLGLTGNVAAPIVFLVLFNIPGILLRFFGLRKTYELGVKFVSLLNENKLMERLSLAASVVGLMVIGAMTSSFVWISTPLSFDIAGVSVVVQDFLDEIMPSLLSLVAVFGIRGLLKKSIKPVTVMFILLVLGVVLSLVGIL